MKGSYLFESGKIALAFLGGAIAANLGGFDRYLMLLVGMILADLLTGFCKALIKKNLASREMMVGIIRKVLIMVCVSISFEVNGALAQYAAEAGVSYNLDLRFFIIMYFVLEELLSVLENMVVIGVPMPKFIIQFLRVVVDTTTNSTPNKIIELMGKIKKLDWLGITAELKEEEEKQEMYDEFAKPDEFEGDN